MSSYFSTLTNNVDEKKMKEEGGGAGVGGEVVGGGMVGEGEANSWVRSDTGKTPTLLVSKTLSRRRKRLDEEEEEEEKEEVVIAIAVAAAAAAVVVEGIRLGLEKKKTAMKKKASVCFLTPCQQKAGLVNTVSWCLERKGRNE